MSWTKGREHVREYRILRVRGIGSTSNIGTAIAKSGIILLISRILGREETHRKRISSDWRQMSRKRHPNASQEKRKRILTNTRSSSPSTCFCVLWSVTVPSSAHLRSAGRLGRTGIYLLCQKPVPETRGRSTNEGDCPHFQVDQINRRIYPNDGDGFHKGPGSWDAAI